MKSPNTFIAYILIGIGTYFLLKEMNIPVLANFYSWPTLLMIIGLILLIHSYKARDYQHLLTGTILFGFGLHFHGLEHYAFWIDHWAIYPFIVGVGFLIRWLKTKEGLWVGILLAGISLMLIFSVQLPSWFHWIYDITALVKNLWPVILIGLGVYLLKKKKCGGLPLSLIYLIYFFIFRQAIFFPFLVFFENGITISFGCSCSISFALC